MRTVTMTVGESAQTEKIPSAAEWPVFAQKLLPSLKPGVVIAVSGDLGAGKTTFIQALAKELGVTSFVPSPTFALLRTYTLTKPKNGIHRLIHVDAYRIENEQELLPLDLDEELADGKSILVIEWPEKIPRWIQSRPVKVALRLS